MSNLLFGDNASFTTSIGTWASAQNGTNFTSSWSSSDQKLRVDVTTGGANIAMAHTGSTFSKPAVTPGQTITMSAKVRQAAGATMRTVRLEGNFYDAANVQLATNAVVTATGSQVTASGTEQTISGTLTVPAGAAYMRARWTAVTPAVGDAFLWDDVVVEDGKAQTGNTLIDRFDGVGMVRQRLDRWSGTAAVQQRIDRTATAAAPATLANEAFATVGGVSYQAQSPDQPYSLAVVADPSTPTYVRCELQAGDRWINDIQNFPNDARQRCELKGSTLWPFSTDVWMAGSVRTSGGTWKVSSSTPPYNIVYQFHQQPEAGEVGKSPCLAFSIEQGNLLVLTRGDTNAVTTVNPDPTTRYSMPWSHDVWVNIVARVRFHWTAGQLQVWINGTQVVNLTGITTAFNDAQGPYSKFGIYRSGHNQPLVVEHANREVGLSSLLSRVTSPLPVPAY